MQGPKLKRLVDNCATLASNGKAVTSYIILYQNKNGTVDFARDGLLSSQLGLMEIAKAGMLNGIQESSDVEA